MDAMENRGGAPVRDIAGSEVYPRILKSHDALLRPPNLDDYERVRRAFRWEAARERLDGLQGGKGLNIAHEAVDRHAAGPRGDRDALRWIGRSGARRTFTYRDLRETTNRFANALVGLGVGAGDTVFVLSGRISELYVAVIGALKVKCVVSPLFSAFGPEPIANSSDDRSRAGPGHDGSALSAKDRRPARSIA